MVVGLVLAVVVLEPLHICERVPEMGVFVSWVQGVGFAGAGLAWESGHSGLSNERALKVRCEVEELCLCDCSRAYVSPEMVALVAFLSFDEKFTKG